MLGAFWDATSNSFGRFVFVTAQYVVGQQDTKDKYESCVPQIQIGFCKEILVEKVHKFSWSGGKLKGGHGHFWLHIQAQVDPLQHVIVICVAFTIFASMT